MTTAALTDEAVLSVVSLLRAGKNFIQIASDLGMAPDMVTAALLKWFDWQRQQAPIARAAS